MKKKNENRVLKACNYPVLGGTVGVKDITGSGIYTGPRHVGYERVGEGADT